MELWMVSACLVLWALPAFYLANSLGHEMKAVVGGLRLCGGGGFRWCCGCCSFEGNLVQKDRTDGGQGVQGVLEVVISTGLGRVTCILWGPSVIMMCIGAAEELHREQGYSMQAQAVCNFRLNCLFEASEQQSYRDCHFITASCKCPA